MCKRAVAIVGLVLLFAGLGYSRENVTGYLDTARITTICTTGVTVNTKVYPLSEFEDIRLVVKVNDSVVAGFANDSIGLIVGYQTGNRVLGSTGTLDTCWDDRIILDTILKSEMGTAGTAVAGADGSTTKTWGGADTSSVSGFAVTNRWFVPEWDQFIRFWVKGLNTNKKGNRLVLFLEPRRRLAVPTGGK